MKKIPYPLPFEYVVARPAFMVFFPIDILSLSGRPILEGRSYIFKDLLADYKRCPYHGCRHNHEKKMNTGALKSIVKNREAIIDIIKSFAFAMFTEKETVAGPLASIWRLAYMGWSAPVFWWMSNKNNEAPVPDELADLSKLCHGILTLVKAIQYDESLDRNFCWDAVDLLDYAEKNHILIGVNEVCAAPSSIIYSILEIIISKTSEPILEHCKFPVETSYKILRFSRYRLTMEYASIAYETARYIVYEEQSDIRPVKQRHSFPYCLTVATWISKASSNFDKICTVYDYQKFQNCFFDNKIRDLMKLCKEFYNRASSTSDQQYLLITMLDSSMLAIIQELNDCIAAVCNFSIGTLNYTKSDLVTFFGPFIANKSAFKVTELNGA